MYFVPEGQHDRSLARSAWDCTTPKSRPVGYGMIRADVAARDSKLEGGNFESGIGKQKRNDPRMAFSGA